MPLRFENCTLDLATREFRRGAELVPLEPQVFDLLVYVIQNRDRVVSKDDLIEAVWGGRIVSESSLTTRINAARKALGDSGEEQRLIRTVARKGIRFVGDVKEGEPGADPKPSDASPDRPTLALPDKPSIAVLPFQNMSGDPEQDYFADGMVEEIITALSRVQSFFVIARNSSFAYKGKQIDVRQVGGELGVRYVLEGSVRKAGRRVRITGQLIDATNNAHIWADKFEGVLDDIFELQDQVTSNVVGAIEPRLQRAEIERAARKPTTRLDAYDLFLLALRCFHLQTKVGSDDGLQLLRKAIEIDGAYPLAHALAAHFYVSRRVQGWASDLAGEADIGMRHAAAALAGAGADPQVLYMVGYAYSHLGSDSRRALDLTEQSLMVNSNSAIVWAQSATLLSLSGEDPTEGVRRAERAFRLSPQDLNKYRLNYAMAVSLFAGQHFKDAIPWAEKSVVDRPDFMPAWRILAAANGLLGNIEKARMAASQLLRIQPTYTISNGREKASFVAPQVYELYSRGLTIAGIAP